MSIAEKKKKNNLRDRIFRPMAILMIVLSLLFVCIGLFLNLKTEEEKRDINLQNAAKMIAKTDILDEVGQDISMEKMNELVDSLQGIDVVSVVDDHNIRIFHTNNDLIGKEYDGVIPDFEKNGTQGYVEDGNGPSGLQRRAYAPIYGAEGEYKGFVLAIELMTNIREEIAKTLILYAIILTAILIAAMMLSSKVSNKIKDTLMGYEPDVFSSMYHFRENILDALDEGVVGVDAGGKLQFTNQAANSMTDSKNNTVVKMLEEPLHTGTKTAGKPLNIDNHSIIMDCIPVKEADQTVGAIAVLHDRTELAHVMEELTGTKYLVDSMRANNHHFTNKLHVILGLIQMEMYDEATNYIQNITMVQRETISNIMNKVDDPAIAALLIGKSARASELNLKFLVDENTNYSMSDVNIPSGVMVTILGNLIENGLEAMDGDTGNGILQSADGKALKVWLVSSENHIYINIEDNGPGMSEDVRNHIFDNGFSTKGTGRGTGLYQVKELVAGADGHIDVVTEPGKGTIFTINIGGM